MTAPDAPDYVVVGGGFFGCCLALFLRSVSSRIVVVEAGDQLMQRASRVNQARIHTGFHYPRSPLTAVKSLVLHKRFAEDFPDAVAADFQMLYAIARRRSRIPAGRFYRMFRDMGAPIAPATPSQAALFDPATIEAVFACTERAFDYTVLRAHLAGQLDALGIEVRLGTAVRQVAETTEGAIARLSTGEELHARFVFNVTYAQLNAVLRTGGYAEAALKHELAEVALVEPPSQLEGYGVTIMDGPFLSLMPFPAEALYSLTHVRYTPHRSWTDQSAGRSAYATLASETPPSRHRHMILDGRRYLPCLTEAVWRRSLYDVKTVLIRNEKDDGRPILFHRRPEGSRIISILGGKFDNIYDLFDLLRHTAPEWVAAHDGYVHARRPAAAWRGGLM